MFGKLKDLLFEEQDDYDEYDDEMEEEQPVIVEKKKKKPAHVEPEPVKIAPVQVRTEPVAPVVEEKKKSLGINIDELQDSSAPSAEPKSSVETKPVVNKPTSRPSTNKDTNKYHYEFSPVISPIFGSHDTDSQPIAIKSTKPAASTDSKVGTVISPMYGINRDQDIDRVTKKQPAKKPTIVTHEEKTAEENVPVMTLDEILAAHRKNDAKNNVEATRTFKADDFDRTVVVNNHNISLFDDDDEEEDD